MGLRKNYPVFCLIATASGVPKIVNDGLNIPATLVSGLTISLKLAHVRRVCSVDKKSSHITSYGVRKNLRK